VSRLSRQCGILNISQFYRPPWPVTGIALLLILLLYVKYLKLLNVSVCLALHKFFYFVLLLSNPEGIIFSNVVTQKHLLKNVTQISTQRPSIKCIRYVNILDSKGGGGSSSLAYRPIFYRLVQNTVFRKLGLFLFSA
jgi:hypothetical protein